MEGSVIASVLAAVVAIATAFFGWLKVRDESRWTGERFQTVHDELERERARLHKLEKEAGQTKAELEECVRHRMVLEERVKNLESRLAEEQSE